MSVTPFVWMRAEVDLLQPPVERFGERRDRRLVERGQRQDLDGTQLAPLPADLVEHHSRILEEPPPEAFVGRQLADDRLYASM